MRLIAVVGARPNVVKVGPLLPELARAGIDVDVAYTGSRASSRSDDASPDVMSFYGVEMPAPRWFLDVGSGTDTVMTGRAMVAFEGLFAEERPDAVLVVGDVNPTLAAALSAAKAGLPVVHLEAGLRCGDLRVPEEVNRVLISRITALHLAPTETALVNLEDEGIEPERVTFVGNTMAESVVRHLDLVASLRVHEGYGLTRREYVLGSVHRPENLGDPERLSAIVAAMDQTAMPALVLDTQSFRSTLERFGIAVPDSVRIVDAVDYGAMIALQRDAAVVVTDSGGVQEEACMVGTPCVTLRDATEHSDTIAAGANRLAPATPDGIVSALNDAIAGGRRWSVPKRWDNAVSDRIVRALRRGVTPIS